MTDAIRIAPGKSLRDTDVLVLGGGPAAAWAAVSAAEAGASVILSGQGLAWHVGGHRAIEHGHVVRPAGR